MPSDIALNITTQYTDTGMKRATSDVKQFAQTTTQATQQASVNFDGLFRRLERPLGFIAFSGLADQITNMGQKGQSATQMLEKGLHTAALALTFFQPELGFAAVAGLALFEAIKKIGEQSNLTADDINNLIKKNEEFAKSARDAALEEAKKNGRKDLILDLQRQADAADNLTRHTKEQALAEVNAARATLQHLLASRDLTKTTLQQIEADDANVQKKKDIVKAQERLTQAEQTYTAVLLDDKNKGDAIRAAELKREQDFFNNVVLAMQDAAKKREQTLSAEYQKEATMLVSFERKSVEAYLKGNTDILGALGVFSNDYIQKTVDMYATQAAAAGYAALASGNFGQAALAFASSAAIEALGGAISSVLSPNTASTASTNATNGTTVANAQNSLSAGQVSGSAQGNSTNLTILVQGGVIDDQFAANLAKRLSDVVSQNNVTLVSSKVVS